MSKQNLGGKKEPLDGWSQVKLDDVVIKRAENVDPGEADVDRHVGLEHITPNTPTPDWEPIENVTSTKRRFYPGDILFAKLRPNLEKAAQPNFGGVASTDIFTIEAEEGINSKYLLYRLSSKQAFDWARRTSAGTRMPRTSWEQFKKLEFGLPSVEEQRKIATVLQNLDNAIANTDKIREKYETVRKGIVVNLFTNGVAESRKTTSTPVGEQPSHWEIERLDDLLTGARYGTDEKSNTDGEGYPTLRIPNVVGKRLTLDDLKYTPLNDDEADRLRLDQGDLLVVRTNGNPDYVGQSIVYDKNGNEDFVFASYLIRLQVDENNLIPEFLREYLHSDRGRSEMKGWIRTSAGNYNLSVGSIEKFRVPIPPIEEQEEIVTRINEIDAAIAANKQHRSQLKKLKHGLMQDLISGDVRTTGSDFEVPDEVSKYG